MAPGRDFDPYQVLGLARGATSAQVARAYRAGAKRAHPDLHGPGAAHRMQDLNRAFRILSDPALRGAWDAAHPAVEVPAPHWTARPRRDPVAGDGGGPAAWADWETTAPATQMAASVRVHSSWPRPAAAPGRAAAGPRDSPWPAVGVALVLVIALLFLGWVASTTRGAASPRQAMAALGVTIAASVSLDPDHELSVFRGSSGSLGLVAAQRSADGWEARVLTEVSTTHPISVIIYQDVAAPQVAFSSIVFGRAEGGVAEVRLPGREGRGGEVVNGTWAVVLSDPISQEDLTWEFVLADGSVILRGSGELPA
ncbi:MAG TPA: J domain-containing protein [Candidatus Limnocylindrales bacterium]|nr:J domain-containing protein [Candidatus Limnocylindrales bacterium]